LPLRENLANGEVIGESAELSNEPVAEAAARDAESVLREDEATEVTIWRDAES
jgi:hypothetical protein